MTQELPEPEGGASVAVDVICLKCGAKPGYGCTTPAGNYTFSHSQRWRDVGVLGANEQDRNRDYAALRIHERRRFENEKGGGA